MRLGAPWPEIDTSSGTGFEVACECPLPHQVVLGDGGPDIVGSCRIDAGEPERSVTIAFDNGTGGGSAGSRLPLVVLISHAGAFRCGGNRGAGDAHPFSPLIPEESE